MTIDVETYQPPEGYDLVPTDLLVEILNLIPGVHTLGMTYEEVEANLRAGQPHPAAIVREKPGALQLVNSQGQKTGSQVEWVAVGIATGLLAGMHGVYSELTRDQRFEDLLVRHGIIEIAEEDDGEEE